MRTLELRRLVERDADGDFLPGPYLAVLSRSVRRSLRAAAAPVRRQARRGPADDGVPGRRRWRRGRDDRQRRATFAQRSRRLPTGHPARRSIAARLAWRCLAARPAEHGERAEVAVARATRLGAQRGRGHRRHGLGRQSDRRRRCGRRAVARPAPTSSADARSVRVAVADSRPPHRVPPRPDSPAGVECFAPTWVPSNNSTAAVWSVRADLGAPNNSTAAVSRVPRRTWVP